MKSLLPPVIVLFNRARRGEPAAEQATATAAAQAAAALAAAGGAVRLLPVRDQLPELVRNLRHARPAVVVNLCEAFAGRPEFEAQVAGVLELMRLPFTGNPSRALALCQDKFRAKAVLAAWGLPTPPGRLVTTPPRRPPAGLRLPLIVKPNAADGSLGLGPDAVVRTPAALSRRVARLLRGGYRPALIETYLPGREFNVAVLETAAGWRTLPPSEIVFDRLPPRLPRIVGYAAKWHPHSAWFRGTPPVCPADVPARLARRLRALALAAAAALGLRGYARVDLRLDRRGRPVILEVNPNPDPARNAGLARALAAAGISYEIFWADQVRRALPAKFNQEPT